MTRAFLVLALIAGTASAGELTVIRPRSVIADDWPIYLLLDDQKRPVADLENGERVTLQVPPGTRRLVIHCSKGLSASYDEVRADLDFKAAERVFFVVSPQPTCFSAERVDAAAAAPFIRQTHERLAGRPIDYQEAQVAVPPKAPASTALAMGAPDSADKDKIAAATAAWVEAFNSRNAARISSLYDAEAVLTDAGESKPRVGTAAIEEYYKTAAKRSTQRVALGERNIRLLGDTAIDSGTLTYFEMRDGNATTTPRRYSLTYQKRAGKWLIVDHQTSIPR